MAVLHFHHQRNKRYAHASPPYVRVWDKRRRRHCCSSPEQLLPMMTGIFWSNNLSSRKDTHIRSGSESKYVATNREWFILQTTQSDSFVRNVESLKHECSIVTRCNWSPSANWQWYHSGLLFCDENVSLNYCQRIISMFRFPAVEPWTRVLLMSYR